MDQIVQVHVDRKILINAYGDCPDEERCFRTSWFSVAL